MGAFSLIIFVSLKIWVFNLVFIFFMERFKLVKFCKFERPSTNFAAPSLSISFSLRMLSINFSIHYFNLFKKNKSVIIFENKNFTTNSDLISLNFVF